MMLELENLVTDLKKSYALKELELNQRLDTNAYSYGELINRKNDVINFEFACSQVVDNQPMKVTIIKNFEERAEEIKLLINKI